ncbi:MAG: DegV family protein [Dehalococcoidales bacterium]|nr:DegV family protein [Dehalococcoidales bacterium]
MKIVVDSGIDLCMTPEQMSEMGIHQVPLSVTFNGKTYREGLDITRDEFYSMISKSNNFPLTSQPSPGTIAGTYKALAAVDPDILSIHMSSGLSGTYQTAILAASLVPEARVTHFDTKTLSVASGWQVIAAARAVKLNWNTEKILPLMKCIGDAVDSIFTLQELRYLVHGGRVSHLKGLMASIFNIKPIIGVEKVKGTYVQMGQAKNFEQAIEGLAGIVSKRCALGSTIRAQVVHAQNQEGANMLQKTMEQLFTCKWLPVCSISLVLGAHTGPSIVGIAYAPEAIMAEIL